MWHITLNLYPLVNPVDLNSTYSCVNTVKWHKLLMNKFMYIFAPSDL